jgi:hypothetical protein
MEEMKEMMAKMRPPPVATPLDDEFDQFMEQEYADDQIGAGSDDEEALEPEDPIE